MYTRGRDEDFSFLAETDPSNIYFLVPELSDHTPAYLWGDAMTTLFQALEQGYSVAATIHADTPEEVFGLFEPPPANISSMLLHHLQVIVNVRMWHRDTRDYEALCRVSRVTLVTPEPSGVMLVEWDPVSDTFIQSDSHLVRAALREHPRLAEDESPLAARMEVLCSWLG